MNRVFSFIILMFFFVGVAAAESDSNPHTRLLTANEVYTSGDYLKASQLYKELVSGDYHSSEIYFNLANSYYKMDMLPEAILNYNRALLLSPNDKDIAHNLNIAETQTTNRIEQVPSFFLKRWVVTLRDMTSSDSWAWLSLLFVVFSFGAALLFYFSRQAVVRKSAFSLALASFTLFVVAISMSIGQRNFVVNNSSAIVMKNAVAVKSSPMDNGTDLFVLNEGAKVDVIERVGNWSEIEIASGNTGWLLSSTLEMVNPKSKR